MVADALRAPPTRAQGQRSALLLVVVITGLVYGAIVAWSVRPYGGNLSSLIYAGANALDAAAGSLGHHVVVYRQTSYDGLSYYYVADDPFLQRRAYRDAFRYQRIGYPLAIWAVSLGRRAWRPAAMVGINLLAVLLVAYLSGLILLQWGDGKTSIWWALAGAINPSLIIAVQRDLGEPLTMACALAGLYLYLRRRTAMATLAFAAALLTRDVAILFLAPIVVAEVLGRRVRRALLLALSVVPYLIWEATVTHVLGHGAEAIAATNFGAPFAGIGVVVRDLAHATGTYRLGWATILVVAVLLCGALLASIAVVYRRYDVIAGGIIAHSAAALCGAEAIWLGYLSAARVFGGIYPLLVFAFARHHTVAFKLLVGGSVLLTIFTLLRYVLASHALPYYLTP